MDLNKIKLPTFTPEASLQITRHRLCNRLTTFNDPVANDYLLLFDSELELRFHREEWKNMYRAERTSDEERTDYDATTADLAELWRKKYGEDVQQQVE